MAHSIAGALVLAGALTLPVSMVAAQEATDQAALSETDQQFVEQTAQGGMAEVELGRMAAEQAESPEVQEFGQRMVDDHTKANEQLQEIAEGKNIELPSELSEEAQQAQQRLSEMSGAEFDQAYIDQMVEDHQKTVELFQREIETGEDAELQEYANQTLPILQEHLDHAQQLDRQLTETAGLTGESGEMDTAATGEEMAETGETDTAAQSEAVAEATDMGETGTAVPAIGEDAATADAGAIQQDGSEEAPAADAGALDQPAEGAEEEIGLADASPAVTSDQDDLEGMEPAAGTPTMDAAFGAMRAEELIGKQVTGQDGEEIGEISDIVINSQDKAVLAIVAVGGFLGIGEKNVAVPFDQLTQGGEEEIVLSGATEDSLKEMPEYEAGAEIYTPYPRDQELGAQN